MTILFKTFLLIASMCPGSEFPAADASRMSAQPEGDFHTAIASVADGEILAIAEEGSLAPLGPAGIKDYAGTENRSYSGLGAEEVRGEAGRSVASGKPRISDCDLWTDKACYRPGEAVWIHAPWFADYPGARVRYRHGAELVREEPLRQEWWSWQPPEKDFTGYLVDVYTLGADGAEKIIASIGVDVSSHWKRFPRNGYTAWYEPGKEPYVEGDVAFLNRRHINVVQFQDWHWKHHRPYCPDGVYTDIANRPVSQKVVKAMIDAQHGYNMKALFYNLGFGALERDGAREDGVSDDWYYFLDEARTVRDYHRLPSDWKSDITFVDPGNGGWQKYICDRTDEVYSHLGFDGFQVDQVGRRGDGYIYLRDGTRHLLADRFPSLLKALKTRQPSKALVMNSVSLHAQEQIASSGVVDACYSELWGGEPDFTDLYRSIDLNRRAGGADMRTIFATYMNYDRGRENGGAAFNTPGVLLTDACIFALGASHLELGTGGNMLCNEYFPNTNLHMDGELTEGITRYYDFITAYENFIYDTERELEPVLTSLSGEEISVWTAFRGPQPRKIVVHGKEAASGARVLHFLNFRNVNSLSWRDAKGDMPRPERIENVALDIDCDRMVSKVWAATPDECAGVARELEFTQQGRSLRVTLPSLEYWTMLVLE